MHLLSDNFAYTDNTEIPFCSDQRDFKSFRQAEQPKLPCRVFMAAFIICKV